MIEYDFDDIQPIDGEIAPVSEFTAEIGVGGVIRILPDDPYDGPFEFTPGDEAQTIETAEKFVGRDITINPIPSNYGKITYNGSWITIT